MFVYMNRLQMELFKELSALLHAEHQQLRISLINELRAMSAEQCEQIDMILQHHRRGDLEPHQIEVFMSNTQRLFEQLRDTSMSSHQQLAQIGEQLEQVFNSKLSQHHQFEMTLICAI